MTPWTLAHQAPWSMEFPMDKKYCISFSRGSCQPSDWTSVSCIVGGVFTAKTPKKAIYVNYIYIISNYFIASVFIANLFCKPICFSYVFSGGLGVKNTPANARHARDMGSVPELGRSPGGRNGNPFQYSCLEKSMDREEPGRPQSVVYIKYSLIYIVVYFLSPNRTLTNTTSNWRCFLIICRCSFKETFKQEIYTWKTPEYCWNLKQGLDD